MIFKKSALNDVSFKYMESGLVVQALKALGREHVDRKVIEGIRQYLKPKTCDRILKDIRSVTGCSRSLILRG